MPAPGGVLDPDPPSRSGAARPYDVVVVGGGVIGLAVAWRARERGLCVAVADDGDGRSASAVAAGMLAPVTEAHYGEEALLRLNLESSRRWPGFASELLERSGLSCGYRRCGTLIVARDRDDNEALDALFAYQARLDLRARRLRGRDCRRLEPALAPSVRGGIFVEGDHQVDPAALVGALRAACRTLGVALVAGRARSVEHSGGRATGVLLQDGTRLEAPAVVVAAGCWSSRIAGVAGALPDVRPVKGQLLQLGRTGSPPLLERNVRGLDVYLVPRADGRVIVGATMEDVGYDTRVTAGAVLELLREAYELVPGITELELTEALAGLRPGTPDNAPVLGPTAIEGLFAATGHFRNGVLLAPLTADALAECVATGTVAPLIEPFGPRRFVSHEAAR